MNKIPRYAIWLPLLAFALALSFIAWRTLQPAESHDHAEPANPLSALHQGKVWVCPMHPEITQDHPGECPICGMDLVEADAAHEGHEHGVHVDAATQQKIGVRLVRAKRSTLHSEIRTYGNVTANARGLHNVYSFFNGVIRKSHVHAVGQQIRKGQVIYEIYSPELNAQQQDFLKYTSRRKQILKSVTGNTVLFENEYVMDLLEELSRERTKFLHEGVGIETVQQLEDRRRVIEIVPILAAESGVVTQINMREGDNVTTAAPLFSLADVSGVWVEAVLYPAQAGQVRAGDKAQVKVNGERVMNGQVELVTPVAQNNKVIARVALGSSENRLRPGTYADVKILSGARETLTLPRSAVMYTGDGATVMLSRGDGHFMPVPVETGAESGDEIEILDGLVEDVEVAANGQFLLDAASSMSATRERMHGEH
jgi:Cu(I)/Ag(I) efflux system membrane fusion protein